MREATPRQQAILDYAIAYINQLNVAPTLQEIATHFEISSWGVFGHLGALEKKGYITREVGKHRGIVITDKQV